jgi:hypothetical protein
VEAEALYQQLSQLAATLPSDLVSDRPISGETHRWIGRLSALLSEEIEMTSDVAAVMDHAAVTTSYDMLTGPLRTSNGHQIVAALHRALGRAELKAPSGTKGGFVGVGAAFDAVQVVGKVLREAKRDALIIDPYMNGTVLTDFALLSAEGVAIRLLTDSFYTKAEALKPIAARWDQQHGKKRPVTVRMTSPRALHDRLIVIDDERVWSLTQSLKDFAGRSPGSVLPVDAEIAAMKREHYRQLWDAGTAL